MNTLSQTTIWLIIKFAYDCQIKACRIKGISASRVYLPKKGAQLQTMSREASEQYLKDNNQ